MKAEHRIVEGEAFGAPVPGRWPGGGDGGTTSRTEQDDAPARETLRSRIARLLWPRPDKPA